MRENTHQFLALETCSWLQGLNTSVIHKWRLILRQLSWVYPAILTMISYAKNSV